MKLSEFDDSKYGGKGDFFELQQGANKLRIVSEFAEKYSHFENRKFLGHCTNSNDCQLCAQGSKPSVKFLCHIIDRKDNQFKIGQFGAMVLKQLRGFSLDPQYQFSIVPNWDCSITKVGTGLETKYTVIPDREDTALTEQEKKVISELKPPYKIVEAMINKKLKTPGSQEQSTEPEIKVEDIPF